MIAREEGASAHGDAADDEGKRLSGESVYRNLGSDASLRFEMLALPGGSPI
jgi:hypothetical protein